MNKIALTGGEAIAYAFKQIGVDVFSMYPITPQTPIIEAFSRFAANGEVDTEIIRTESEHSALSATIGASAAGARAVTATSSQGLLYMYEMLSVASGLRLPIVMPIANRAISAPINIHCDHSDSMSALDQGWMQVYCENAQEAYEMTIFSQKLSEKCYLPIMVCIDGFFTSHNLIPVTIFEDKKVKDFVGEFKPAYNLLDTEKPITVGALALPDSYFEIRKGMFDAFLDVKNNYLSVAKDFKKSFGKDINFYDDYFASTSETVLVVLSSTAQNAKNVIDKLRSQKKNVGLLRPILYRPFLYEEYVKPLSKAKNIIVLERSEGPGSFSPVYKDIVLTIFNSERKDKPQIFSYVFGLGGREISEKEIEDLLLSVLNGKPNKKRYIGIKE
jgi:pyruvate ferredoxin oxidoreductase alpha subunit